MGIFVWSWLLTALVLLPLDFVWLKTMRGFYAREMGDLLMAEPRYGIAALFYIFYSGAIAWLAIGPHAGSGNGLQVALAGAVLGFAAYGAYDVTNYATLRGFPMSVMIVDWMWGTFLTATAALGGYLLLRAFGLAT